jgi:hypothetical protein
MASASRHQLPAALHEKADNIDDARKNAERVATLAFKMDAGLFGRVSDRLCYWLDAVDEQLAGFSGAVCLWERLLPYAVDRENANISDSAVEADLYTIALNVPFGHLIFFFLRRCPTMPAEGETPPLPEPFVGLLKEVKGRARLLLATRMATTMNYFWRADEDWLKDVALEPMLSNGHEGTVLWEAFAKYGPVPSHTLWQVIEAPLIKHVAQGAGMKHYSNAVRTIIPFLRPFEVWDIDSEFGLSEEMNDIVLTYPTETLALLAACVSKGQNHSIFGLGRVLSSIIGSNPELERGPEFRRLRRFVPNDEITTSAE